MTVLAAMQPYWFPYLGYFQLLHASDVFVCYGGLRFRKQSWITRNRLRTRAGAVFPITVPVRRRRRNATPAIRDVRVDGDHWREKLSRSLSVHYARAPHFDLVRGLVDRVLARETDSLTELAVAGIVEVARCLRIPCRIVEDPKLQALESELRDGRAADRRRVDRAIGMCRAFDAGTYVNPVSGAHLYPAAPFEAAGLARALLRPRPVRYRQWDDVTFVADLSILDVLMHRGPAGTAELLAEYDVLSVVEDS